jgi:hypothetical protein
VTSGEPIDLTGRGSHTLVRQPRPGAALEWFDATRDF